MKKIISVKIIFVSLLFPVLAFAATFADYDGKFFTAGDLVKVKELIKSNDYDDSSKIEGLEDAVDGNQMELVKYLETLGWMEPCKKNASCNLLNFAALSKDKKMVDYIITKGFKPTVFSLHIASLVDFQMVKTLCDLISENEFQKEFLDPVEQHDQHIIKKLEKDLEPRSQALDGNLKFQRPVLIEINSLAYIKSGQCKAGGIAPSFQDIHNQLETAFLNHQIDDAKKLMLKINLNDEQDFFVVLFFYEAMNLNELSFIKMLDEKGWVEKCKKITGCQPLQFAASAENIPMLEFLLAKGFDVNAVNTVDYTSALNNAAQNDDLATVKFLCEQGANYRKYLGNDSSYTTLINILRPLYSTSINFTKVYDYFITGQCKAKNFEGCAEREAKFGWVIASSINLRAEPNVASIALQSLPYKTVFNVLEDNQECSEVNGVKGRWVRVRVSYSENSLLYGQEGWVFDANVDFTSTEPIFYDPEG